MDRIPPNPPLKKEGRKKAFPPFSKGGKSSHIFPSPLRGEGRVGVKMSRDPGSFPPPTNPLPPGEGEILKETDLGARVKKAINFIGDESGSPAAEYAILAALIAMAIVVAVTGLGATVRTFFEGVLPAFQ
jgi:pilus assembly protein Flp/PilA